MLEWLPWIILAAFGSVFVFAGVHEYRRRRDLDAPEDPRAAFEFNEDAPSYEEPAAPEPDESETAPDQAADEDTDDTGEGPHDSERREPEMSDTKTRIDELVNSNDVVLYMKGTKSMPQCGFSSRVAGVLNYMGVEFTDVNVLADEDIRQGIKDYSDWPTIPQLYVKGEFVGGCDIITEMTLSGELDQLFDEKGVTYDKQAAEKIREANA
jgi:monothiol glutaredoxin